MRTAHSATFFVPGDGPLNPDIMLIGEAPGRLENAKRMPFVGRAGTNLVNILIDLDIDPFHVYMTNVIKYWPRYSDGRTRTPETDEIAKSREYLIEEINIVNPKIIGLCGYSAIKAIYPKIPNVYHSHAELLDGKYVPLYHPATITWPGANKELTKSGYAKLVKYLETQIGNSSPTGSRL